MNLGFGRGRSLVYGTLLACVVGCGAQVEQIAGPIPVKGKATLNGGRAVSGVAITLQPLDKGHPATLEVTADGSFSGQATPGKYAYFIGPSSDRKSKGLSLIPAKYQQADMARTVSVAEGQELTIVLD